MSHFDPQYEPVPERVEISIDDQEHGARPTGMQYLYAYNYVFENQNWIMNLLCGTVCQLIPFIGPLVFLGYQFEIVEALHRRPGRTYPDFDFNRFVDYLTRGVWPFLVALLASVVIVPLMMVLVYGPMILIFLAGTADDAAAGIAAAIVIPLAILLGVALFVLIGLLMTPIVLRAGLAQDFGKAFDLAFAKGFVRRVWVEMVLACLFLMVTYPIILMGGMALCFVGVYPAAVLFMLAQIHLVYQLYELYLARGGTPIPLKEAVKPAAAK